MQLELEFVLSLRDRLQEHQMMKLRPCVWRLLVSQPFGKQQVLQFVRCCFVRTPVQLLVSHYSSRNAKLVLTLVLVGGKVLDKRKCQFVYRL